MFDSGFNVIYANSDNQNTQPISGFLLEPADWFIYTRRFCQRFAPIFSILLSFTHRQMMVFTTADSPFAKRRFTRSSLVNSLGRASR